MTMARAHLVDVAVTRWYHCVTRCVRQAFLLGEGDIDRKEWIDDACKNLQESSRFRSVGFRSWITICICWCASTRRLPAAGRMRKSCGAGAGSFRHGTSPDSRCRFPTTGFRAPQGRRVGGDDTRAIAKPQLVHEVLEGAAVAAGQPARSDAGRVLRGAVQERGDSGRGIAAGDVCVHRSEPGGGRDRRSSGSESAHVDQDAGRAREGSGIEPSDLEAAEQGSVAGSRASAGLEESLWLCPIEDRRRLDSSREGMLEGFSLGSYLLLVDYTGRLFREGKSVISAEVSGILDRLGSSAESWWSRLEKLSRGRLLGRFFAASRERLRDVARAPGSASPGEPGWMPGAIRALFDFGRCVCMPSLVSPVWPCSTAFQGHHT